MFFFMLLYFFFFKQKTAYEMRISDWSSDVCSSDLRDGGNERRAQILQEQIHDEEHEDNRLEQRLDHFLDRQSHERRGVVRVDGFENRRKCREQVVDRRAHVLGGVEEIGREMCREQMRPVG